MENAVQALKDLTPYVLATFGVILGAFVITMMFGFMDEDVIPNLGLEVNASNTSLASTAASTIVQDGADGIYDLAAIVLTATGLMALATVMTAFGFRKFERFDIGSSKLIKLVTQIGTVTGIYGAIIFALAFVRIIVGYLDEVLVDTLGFSAGGWVITALDTLTALVTTVIAGITPLLGLGVGLVTLGLVLSAFGFKIEFGKMGKGNSM